MIFAPLPPRLGSLHSKTVVERGSRTGPRHSFFAEGAIEHRKLPQLLLLEEVLGFILHRNKQELLTLVLQDGLKENCFKEFKKDIRWWRHTTGFSRSSRISRCINNFHRQLCLNQYMKGFIQMFISWLPSHHFLLQNNCISDLSSITQNKQMDTCIKVSSMLKDWWSCLVRVPARKWILKNHQVVLVFISIQKLEETYKETILKAKT